MADQRMGLLELLRKAGTGGDVDFLREGVRVLAQALMEAEVTELTGAARGERNPDARLTHRNGYRDRRWDTRAGTIDPAVPSVRDGSYLPSLPEPRRRAGRALLERGLADVRLVASDAHRGIVEASQLPGAAWQRCRVHATRNALDLVPRGSRGMVAAAARSVFEQPASTPRRSSCAGWRTAGRDRAGAVLPPLGEPVVASRQSLRGRVQLPTGGQARRKPGEPTSQSADVRPRCGRSEARRKPACRSRRYSPDERRLWSTARAGSTALPRHARASTEAQRMDPAREPATTTAAPPAHAPGAGAGVNLAGITLTFRGARTTRVLDGIDLEIRPREVIALIGPNGCGKSTLLRVLAGLIPADAGVVAIDGHRVNGPDPRVGLVFQEPRLLAWRSAEDNVRFPMELAGWSRQRQAARADDLLGLVGLREYARSRPGTLSGGTRQRVSIARALALEPSLLLLDEPFSALDALTRERFNLELLRLWERTGTTIVLVTHSIPEAVFLADRVIVLSPRPARVLADIPVALPRPRRLSDLDSAFVSSLASDVRGHLVDTTDDAIAMEEARTAVPAGLTPGDRPERFAETEPGTPAWFDPFAPEDGE